MNISLIKQLKHIYVLLSLRYLMLLCLLGINFNLIGQAFRKNLSIATSDNHTSIDKINVLHNELYSYGSGGISLIFNYKNYKEQEFNVSSQRKLFIAKYNDTGQYTKAISIGGNANNLNGGMCSLGNNTIGVTGVFASGYYENYTKYSSSSKGMFITAIDTALQFRWRLILKANSNFHCNLITPDGQGNFYAAGYFSDSLQIGSTNYIAKNHKDSIDRKKDIFIIHATQTGTILNTCTMGSFGNDYPTALVCDHLGNLIVAAVISDTVTLGTQIYRQQSKSKCVIFKISAAGVTSWIDGFSGAGAVISSLSYNSKNEIISGASFIGGLTIKYKIGSLRIVSDSSSNQIIIAVFDNDGKVLRYKTEGSENPVKLGALCVDKDDNIHIAGTFQCTFTGYNKQNETFSFKNVGFNDIFQSAYDNKLNSLWQKHAGGPREDNLTDIEIWNNTPTISGNFSQRISITSDSVVPVINGYGHYDRTYLGNSIYNPFQLNVTGYSKYSSGRTNFAGFFTNLLDATSPQLNYYRSTQISSPKFAEKPIWLKDIQNFSDTFCDAGRLYFMWVMDGNIDQDYESRNNGPFVDYYVNGVKKSFRQIYNEPITTVSGTFKLDLKTIDGCYSESIQTKITIVKRKYLEIGYDKSKLFNSQYLVICNNDSTKLTATKTYGLNYYWVVDYQDFELDTGQYSDTVNKMVYKTVKRDTFYTNSITVKKSAQVSLIVPYNNNQCVESTGINIRKLSFEKADSLIAEFDEESDSLCTSNTIASTAFKLKIVDKKTGLYKNVAFFLEYKLNGVTATPYTAYTNQNIMFSVNKSDTIRVEGTMNLGCEKRKFSIKKYYNFIKPKINLTGKLSKCKDEEHIFTADSTFKRYVWNVSGSPVKPTITYITPWKVKVKGSVSSIAVTGYLDTIPYNSCAASAYKNVTYNSTSPTTSDINPPIICPNKSIVLSVTDGKDFLWFPNGETTKQITTNQAGVYYCTYLDTAGCPIKSSPIELSESFKPDLLIEPDDGLCPGQNAELFVTVPKYATIFWQQPSSWGNKNTITTNYKGIVKCSTNVCNTPYLMQAVIAEKKQNTYTHYHYDSICPKQSVNMVSHDSETYVYRWSYLKNVVFNNSKIVSYNAGQALSDKNSIKTDSAGIYLVEAKDACDNWYQSDFFILKSRAKSGVNSTIKKEICGKDSFIFDIKLESKFKIDSFSKCLWFNDNDTSFSKKIYSNNNHYKAIVTSRFCSAVDTISLMVKNKIKPQINLISKKEVCKGEVVTLNASLINWKMDSSSVYWNNKLGTGLNKTATINSTTSFKVSINDTCGLSEDSITIRPILILANFSSNYDLDLDKTELLDNSVGVNIVKWAWYVNNNMWSESQNTEILSPNYEDQLVCLKVENSIGCRDSICKTLPPIPTPDFYIPNVFNPNSKFTINTKFAPIGSKHLKYSMVIFNRWGEKLFEGGEETGGWDGTYRGEFCQDGAYLYLLSVEYTNSKGIKLEEKLKGIIMIFK